MTSSTQPSVQYEDFTPKFEWKEEIESNILCIYLSDFIKEQLKITFVSSTRTLRVTGERQIAGNKWRRFNQPYRVPQNCEVTKIHAKFFNGVLTITMPKAIMEQAAPPELDTKPTTTQEAPTPQKPAPTIPEIKEQKGLEKITEKVGTSKEQVGEGVGTPSLPERRKVSKPQKGMEEVTGKVGTSQEKDGKKVGRAPTLQQILEESKPEKDQIDQAPTEQTPREAIIGRGDKSLAEQEEEVSKKRKETLIVPPETDRESRIKKRKESPTEGKGKSVVKSKNSAMELVAGKVEKVKGVAAAAKDAVKELAMEISENRQGMVKIGVAVIVIAAVAAYLYYRYRSYGTTDQE